MVTAVQISQIFPPKNLEKIRALKIRMRRFFFFKKSFQLVMLCLKILYFPAKKLRKNTGAQNTHAPFFLKKNQGNNFNI